MAGRHQAPQPELAARLRDMPFEHLKNRIPNLETTFSSSVLQSSGRY